VTSKDLQPADAGRAPDAKDVLAILIVAPFSERYLKMIRALFRRRVCAGPPLEPVQG